MIQITAYLRDEEDLKKWKALPNKAEWLHNNLIAEQVKPEDDKKALKKGEPRTSTGKKL
jgi:hypothetical protein